MIANTLKRRVAEMARSQCGIVQMTMILGLSGSLRNARFGIGNAKLVAELSALPDVTALTEFLASQTKLRVEDFLEAGRKEKRPFDETFKALGKLRGDRGLSNSEASMAAALWGAQQEGARIDHLALSSHFPPNGQIRHADRLKRQLLEADGIIVSGPVYFGDRGSLVQSLFDFMASDPEIKAALSRKVYGGLAVGAKRNGGQETTLIYQMLDMLQMGALVVGNGDETTAQYGGTAVAGDVGTLAKDGYGIETSIGTGRRVARVSELMAKSSPDAALTDKLNVHLWLLQDSVDRRGLALYRQWAADLEARNPSVKATIFDAAGSEVMRCIACDVCPTHVGARDDYRCIITSGDDFFVQHHDALIGADAILLGAYSPENRSEIKSVYQQFIERTRYLRRDNYVFEDLLVAPFVISEMEARQHLHVRMATSIIRHHTVVHKPLVGFVREGAFLNRDKVDQVTDRFVAAARELLIGKYLSGEKRDVVYNPVGYEISMAKAVEDRATGRMADALRDAAGARTKAARVRLAG